jgi:hypothetical protein
MKFEIKELCDVDADLSNSLLDSIDKDHWKINTTRQKVYEVHRFTETIRLRHVKNLDFNNFKFVNYEMFDFYKPVIDKYLKIISKYFEIKDYTALIVNLKPKGMIDTHTDGGSRYFQLGHRLHIPIKTNENVFFTVGNMRENMKVGKIYEIDNLNSHSVENHSTENRIHLIMDIFDKNIKEFPEYWMN